MGLQGQANLDNTPAQQDQADGADQAEDELRQVVHNGQGIAAGGSSGSSQGEHTGDSQNSQCVVAEAALNLAGDGELFGVGLFVFLEQFHGFLSPS